VRNLSIQFLVGFLSLSTVAAAKSPFAGTWEGKINDQPGVELTIEDAGGKVSGVVVFYFQLRGEDGKWHVADKFTEPLLAPQVKGKILTFEASHHKSHGSSELGPNVKFRMELTSAHEAVLRKVEDQPDAGPGFKLTRRR
jgi:hypothetical protein